MYYSIYTPTDEFKYGENKFLQFSWSNKLFPVYQLYCPGNADIIITQTKKSGDGVPHAWGTEGVIPHTFQ